MTKKELLATSLFNRSEIQRQTGLHYQKATRTLNGMALNRGDSLTVDETERLISFIESQSSIAVSALRASIRTANEYKRTNAPLELTHKRNE